MKKILLLCFVITSQSILTSQNTPSENTQREKEQKLLQAVLSNDPEQVQKVLDLGANPKRNTRYGSLLFFAFHYESFKVIPTLIKAGINVNTQDVDDKKTPLMLATRNYRLEIMEALLKAGAQVDAQHTDGYTNGYTALMFASDDLIDNPNRKRIHEHNLKYRLSAIALLIQYGASPNIRNILGQTASDLTQNPEIKQFLAKEIVKEEALTDLSSFLQL